MYFWIVHLKTELKSDIWFCFLNFLFKRSFENIFFKCQNVKYKKMPNKNYTVYIILITALYKIKNSWLSYTLKMKIIKNIHF